MSINDNLLLKDKHVLLYDNMDENLLFESIKNNFCGKVLTTLNDYIYTESTLLYLCGNINKIYLNNKLDQYNFTEILIINELSHNIDINMINYTLISINEVPLNIHNVGIFFKNMFSLDKNYFKLDDIKRIAGTSAGALLGTFLAVGYKLDDILNLSL